MEQPTIHRSKKTKKSSNQQQEHRRRSGHDGGQDVAGASSREGSSESRRGKKAGRDTCGLLKEKRISGVKRQRVKCVGASASETSSRKRKKQNQRTADASQNKLGKSTSGKKRRKDLSLQAQFKLKLESGQFRWLNEELYSTPSERAVNLFRESPELYNVYHRGFETQVGKWPVNPVEKIASLIRKQMPHKWVVGDFGCGNALIARTVPQKCHSFDLCETNEFVTVANSADVPLDNSCLDVAVFCLSLMGTDFERFLLEARRTLKPDGLLIVAEVKSRFSGADADALSGPEAGRDERSVVKERAMQSGIASFKKILDQLGFKLLNEDCSNKMFVMFQFSKSQVSEKREAKLYAKFSKVKKVETILKSCKYKKR